MQPDLNVEELSRAKLRTNLKSREKQTKFVYTTEHDAFLANKLTDYRINRILRGTGGRNQPGLSKSKVHQQIAIEFNAKFDATLEGAQIKNKIANMQRLWKDTRKSINAIDNGDLDEDALRDQALKRCSFFYIMEPIWATSWSQAPRTAIEGPVDSTEEIIQDAGADEDKDDEDEDDVMDKSRDAGEDSAVTARTGSVSTANGGSETISRNATKTQAQLGELVVDLQDAKKMVEFSIREQEATKRHIADLNHSMGIEEQTTRRELERLRLEKEKIIEMERTKQLAIQLQIEQTKLERLRMEYKLRMGPRKTAGDGASPASGCHSMEETSTA
ncbi:hypothetical protein BGZ54_009409 [Gamsiella multidivaricata]|nr:hypothetical protein BGZ54_009409 [Gamsiella multidivaricata]